jgi:Domain of unknown function (DUF4178)
MIWLMVGVVVVVAIAATVLRQAQLSGGGSSRPAALPGLKRTVFDLQVGDIVQYGGEDWVVEGRLTYNDGGYTWLEYLLQDGDRIRWLSVEEDDRLQVLWLETIADVDVTGTPPRSLTLANVAYRQVESGTARMSRTGTTLNRQAQRCQYFDYDGPGEQVLSIENWDGDIEVTAGVRISPRSLILLPGDGKRVYGE